MNNISKTHQRFSELLNNSRVLTNPEEFLGPNYKEVLNFWLILDELSKEQLRDVQECYWAFINEERSEWSKLAIDSFKDAVGKNCAIEAGWAAWDVTNSAAEWTTHELIVMHKILEDHQQSLTIFNMFLEVL